MDIALLNRIREITPKFNESIANGLAVEHMMGVNKETGVNNTMAYIDRLIQVSRVFFPEGLVYNGSQICSPIKHFEEITREYNSKRTANIARSDTYLVKYQFSYHGEPLIPRYILLPFVRDGGLITLNGATYNISPVLTDVGFSVLRGSIYIPFRRAKSTFNRVPYHFYANNRREIVYVIWSTIHNEMNKRKKSDLDGRRYIHSSLAHYFFCKWGVTQTFKQWGNVDVQIGRRKEFPKDEYNMKNYIISESSHLKDRHPAGEICLVYPREQDSDFARMLVGGFFYVMDTFPNRFKEPSYADDINHWRLLLGNLVFGDFEHAGKLLENIETHLDHSFENSLDEITREELRGRNIYVNNIWELLYKIMTDLSHHFYQTSSDEASMYNKRLTVLYYVLEQLNYAISMFGSAFQSRRDKTWTAHEINERLKKYFKLNTCIKEFNKHGELDTVSYPGDNKIFRITSMLVPQDKAKKSQNYGKGLITDASRVLHASIAEVGQFNNQPKNNPDGRSRINPMVQTEVDGTIRKRPEREELIEMTQKRINR